MKKILLLLVLVCLLCGCTQPGNQTPPTTEPSVVVTEAPTTAPATEPTLAPLAEVELEAVNVHSFRSSKEKPAVAVIDHRTAAFLTTEYPDKDYSKKCTRVQVVDLHMDSLRAETVLEGTYIPLLCCGAPDSLALVNPQTRDVLVLDRELQEVLSFQARDAEGVLSADLQTYYFTRGSQLYFQEPATGGSAPIQLDYDLTFHEVLGYDARENILLVSAYTGIFSGDMSVVAVDLDTETFALLYPDVTGGRMAGEGVLLEKENQDDLSSDIFYGDWTDSRLLGLSGLLVNNLNYAGWHVEGTDYVCRVTYDKVNSVSIAEFELFRLGETVTVCSLQEMLGGAKITQIYALPDGNLLAMETTGRGYRPYLICPELLEFTEAELETVQGAELVDESLAESASMVENWELPENLIQVRQQADELEKKYGITILLSGQCTQVLKETGMDITTTDLAGMPDEAAAIAEALEILDEQLALYPEDFFRQFRNDAEERGLLVMLVEDFHDELNVIGRFWEMGQWYPIAVDITSGEVASTYCHEIWHATEKRINDLNKTALDLEHWDNCNPTGFQYSGNRTPSYVQDTQYTYFYGDPSEGVYFVDPYAKINGHEDRARLMEYVMGSDWHAGQILKYPAIRAKLLVLCNAIRSAFDTENWGKVHWERFF